MFEDVLDEVLFDEQFNVGLDHGHLRHPRVVMLHLPVPIQQEL